MNANSLAASAIVADFYGWGFCRDVFAWASSYGFSCSITLALTLADTHGAIATAKVTGPPPIPKPAPAIAGTLTAPAVVPNPAARMPYWQAPAVTPVTPGRFHVGIIHGKKSPAGAAPITVTDVDANSPASVGVDVLDTTPTASTKGRHGSKIAFQVARADGKTGNGKVRVDVDYTSLIAAEGGDYAQRMQLVQGPPCMLTTPDLPACAGLPIPSTNDVAHSTLTATVDASDPTAAGANARTGLAARSATMRAVQPNAASGATTYAVSGSSTPYAAAPLTAAGKWNVGLQSGAFSYSYPVTVPPPVAGVVPSLALNYSSQSVDGRASATNTQASWTGMGWDLQPGSIQQRFASCADLGHTATSDPLVSEQCDAGTAYYSITLDGMTGDLVYDSASALWHLKDDNGWKVERLHLPAGTSNGDALGEYFRVTDLAGTQYYFGLGSDAGLTTNSVFTMPVFADTAGRPCYSSTVTASFCQRGWKFNLDKIVDTDGNKIVYEWAQETNLYARNHATPTSYVRGGYPLRVNYRYNGTQTAPGAKVEFTVADRCATQTCPAPGPTTGASYPDVPTDLMCSATCDTTTQVSPTFFTTKELTRLDTYARSTSTARWQTVGTLAMTYTFPDPGYSLAPSLWLAMLTPTGVMNPAAQGTPTDVALNKTATVSGSESASYPASYAVDGNSTTRWASARTTAEWLQVDLGATYALSQVQIRWGNGYASGYKIQLSPDGTTWTDAYATTVGAGGTENMTISGPARYIKLQETAGGPYANMSVFDFNVYGVTPSAPVTTSMPPTTFTGTVLANRPGSAAVSRMFRVTTIMSSLGGQTNVTYGQPNGACFSGGYPYEPDPSTNWRDCYPVYVGSAPDDYDLVGWPHNGLVWQNRYVVTAVTVHDPVGGTPDSVTNYGYGPAAWASSTDPLIPAASRTWGDSRGYQQVTVTTPAYGTWSSGSFEGRTDTYLYYRGMNGDATAAGGTKTVNVTDSTGASTPDNPELAGQLRETRSYRGPSAGGTETTGALTTYTSWDSTHDSTPVSRAHFVRASQNVARQTISTGSRSTLTNTLYDTGTGMPTTVQDLGDPTTPTDDTCSTTSYVAGTSQVLSSKVWDHIAGAACLTAPVGPVTVPDPATGGWALNGSAAVGPSGVVLTPATASLAGDVIYPTAVPSQGLDVTFTSTMATGAGGANGIALMFLDPATSTTSSIGTNAGGMAFAGLTGVAVVLNTYPDPTYPSGNFVGVSDGAVAGSGNQRLHWLATNTVIPALRTGSHMVHAHIAGGHVTVAIDSGTPLDVAVTVPANVLVGFGAGTGGWTDTHIISNVTVTAATTTTAGVGGQGSGLPLRRTDLVHDTLGHTTQSTTWVDATHSVVTNMTYDTCGRSTSTTDGNRNVTTTAYNPASCVMPQTVTTTNAVGMTTTTAEDYATGATTDTTDENGKTTHLQYDGLGRLTQVWLPGISRTGPASDQYAYTVSQSAPSSVRSDVYVAGSYQSSWTLVDGLGDVRQTQQQTTAGQVLVATTDYGSGLPLVTTPATAVTGTAGQGLLAFNRWQSDGGWNATQYDGFGRPLSSTRNYMTATPVTTSTAYSGDTTTVTPPAPLGTTITRTDPLGRMISKQEHSGAAGALATTSYAYDTLGQLITLTDAEGNASRYVYDGLGHRIASSDPDAGDSTSTFDANGNVTTSTDAKTQLISTSYDALNRPLQQRTGSATGALLSSRTYDTAPNGTVVKGMLFTATSYDTAANAYTTAYTYDQNYRVASKTLTVPAAQGSLAGTYAINGMTYDETGAPLTASYPAVANLPAETVAYGYDSIRRPTTMSGTAGSVTSTYVQGTTYDPINRVIGQNLGNAGAITTQLNKFYDGITGKVSLLSSTVTTATGNLSGYPTYDTFSYDAAGNRVADNMWSPTSYSNYQTACSMYDAVGRLTQAFTVNTNGITTCGGHGDGSGPGPYDVAYAYSATGNMLTEGTPGGSTAAYTYPVAGAGVAQPHAVIATPKGVGYTYDANGSMITAPGRTMTWDTLNRLASVTTAAGTESYIYDADGQRLIRKNLTNTTLFNDGQEITATGSTLTGTRYYGSAALRNGASDVWYLATNDQGSIAAAVQAVTGTVTHELYDAWGAARGINGSPGGDRGFLGKPTDTTGLSYLGARYYDPAIHKFLSTDPEMAPNNPQRCNPYTYADNNPTTTSDPSGLRPLDLGSNGQANMPLQRQTYTPVVAQKPQHRAPAQHAPTRAQVVSMTKNCGSCGQHQNGRASTAPSGGGGLESVWNNSAAGPGFDPPKSSSHMVTTAPDRFGRRITYDASKIVKSTGGLQALRPAGTGGSGLNPDVVATVAGGISAVTGTVAAGLAMTGVGLPAAGILTGISLGTGAISTAIDCRHGVTVSCGVDAAATVAGAGGVALRVAGNAGRLGVGSKELGHSLDAGLGVWGVGLTSVSVGVAVTGGEAE